MRCKLLLPCQARGGVQPELFEGSAGVPYLYQLLLRPELHRTHIAHIVVGDYHTAREQIIIDEWLYTLRVRQHSRKDDLFAVQSVIDRAAVVKQSSVRSYGIEKHPVSQRQQLAEAAPQVIEKIKYAPARPRRQELFDQIFQPHHSDII